MVKRGHHNRIEYNICDVCTVAIASAAESCPHDRNNGNVLADVNTIDQFSSLHLLGDVTAFFWVCRTLPQPSFC